LCTCASAASRSGTIVCPPPFCTSSLCPPPLRLGGTPWPDILRSPSPWSDILKSQLSSDFLYTIQLLADFREFLPDSSELLPLRADFSEFLICCLCLHIIHNAASEFQYTIHLVISYTQMSFELTFQNFNLPCPPPPRCPLLSPCQMRAHRLGPREEEGGGVLRECGPICIQACVHWSLRGL